MSTRPKPFPFAAVRFKAWKVGSSGTAYPVSLPDCVETADEAATMANAQHKESVLVLHSNDALRPEKRHVLSVYVIRKGKAEYRRIDGQTVRVEPLKADLVTRFAVAAGFAPIRPFDAFCDNPVGLDLTLVEG